MKASDPKCYTSVDIGNVVSWQTIGNDAPMTIPVNGFLAVYLSNASSFVQCDHCSMSEGDVYFDKLKIDISMGHLKEETHYYPFGLPMAGIGSSAMGMTPNRRKYQSNEYITDAGLNWMSFGARQYDPQLGRFLSVDPMASQGGQDMLSPYQAMGNEPVSMTDPMGLAPPQKLVIREKPTDLNPLAAMLTYLSGTTLKEVFSGAADPLNQSFWYDHQVGKDGQVYTVVRDMEGNVLSATTGDLGNSNSGNVPKNEENDATGASQGAHINATNLPQGSSMAGVPLDQTQFAKDVNELFMDLSPWGMVNIPLKYATGTSLLGNHVSGMSPFEAIVPVAGKLGEGAYLLDGASEMGKSVEVIKPISEGSLIEEIPGKTDYIRPIQKPNIKTYFPHSNGKWYVWPVRAAGVAGGIYYIWYKTPKRTK